MGLYFRKSVKLGGGVRLNFSKSGMSVSTGVKGARCCVGPKGAVITVGRKGVYYKKQISLKANKRSYKPAQDNNLQENEEGEIHEFPTADVSELIDSSSQDLINQLNENLSSFCYGPFFRNCAILLACFTTSLPADMRWPVGFMILIPGLILAASADKADRRRRTATIFYELHDDSEIAFAKVQQASAELAKALKIYRIEGFQEFSDQSKKPVRSTALVSEQNEPPLVETNLAIPSIQTHSISLFFLPDQVLLFQKGQYGSISNESLQISYKAIQTLETETVPEDAEQVGRTWLYTKADGTQDMRYTRNNREIPIVLYGFLFITSDSGVNLAFQVSNATCAKKFSEAFSEHHQQVRGGAKPSEKETNDYDDSKTQARKMNSEFTEEAKVAQNTDSTKSPYSILNIPTNASRDQINTAYHRMVQMYHPDKVAGLAPEFTQLAELRMREINAAYEALEARQ